MLLGLVDKKKGLVARRRMFLLTDGMEDSDLGTQRIPHLYYVDPVKVFYLEIIVYFYCVPCFNFIS